MSGTNGSQPSALSNLASIIIPCCGMLEYTKLLVPSLLEHTREPYELIFMDIGSLDGTAEYLAGLAAGVRHCRVAVVRAETDLGIPDACREALGTAAGEYVVLLNNDTIVTAVNSFAKDRQEKHAGKWLQVERLGGFCLLMTRAVLNKLGSAVNEWSDLGLFDTDILSAKAREAGFALAVCRDVFIHHFGTRTFAHGGGKVPAHDSGEGVR